MQWCVMHPPGELPPPLDRPRPLLRSPFAGTEPGATLSSDRAHALHLWWLIGEGNMLVAALPCPPPGAAHTVVHLRLSCPEASAAHDHGVSALRKYFLLRAVALVVRRAAHSGA